MIKYLLGRYRIHRHELDLTLSGLMPLVRPEADLFTMSHMLLQVRLGC